MLDKILYVFVKGDMPL